MISSLWSATAVGKWGSGAVGGNGGFLVVLKTNLLPYPALLLLSFTLVCYYFFCCVLHLEEEYHYTLNYKQG